MKKFNIEFLHDDIRNIDYGGTEPLIGLEGKIIIGNYEENFLISIDTL